jgi:hypothetical protein
LPYLPYILAQLNGKSNKNLQKGKEISPDQQQHSDSAVQVK